MLLAKSQSNDRTLVLLIQPNKNLLFIGSHGKYVEIGKYLIESERETLANNLRCTIQGA